MKREMPCVMRGGVYVSGVQIKAERLRTELRIAGELRAGAAMRTSAPEEYDGLYRIYPMSKEEANEEEY